MQTFSASVEVQESLQMRLKVHFSAAVGVPKSLQMRLKVYSYRMQPFWSPTALTSVRRDWYKIKLLKFKLMASMKNNSEFKLMVIYLEA